MAKMHKIVKHLVWAMGADNGCTFHPTVVQLDALYGGVMQMWQAGCRFTDADVELLTAGEVSERDRAMSRYSGYASVNRTLGRIFNGRAS